MFVFALLALAGTTTLALQVDQPKDTVHSSSPITITWTSDINADQSLFSIELINQSFNRQYAIANNVNPDDHTITLTLPEVPAGPNYSIEFVNISNINTVYSATSDFSIEDAVSTTASSTSSTSSSASGSSGTSSDAATTTKHTTTSAFGVTRTASTTSTSAAQTGSGTDAAGSQSSSASASVPSSFNAATSFGSSATMGVLAGVLALFAL